jgi:type II secretory pathway predicted ATPase ExeA
MTPFSGDRAMSTATLASPVSMKAFFGFTRHPFPPSCPPEPLYRSGSVEAALKAAKDAIASRLHVLVTAPAGSGKSSFLRLLVSELNPRDVRPVRLTGQGLGSMEIVQKVADELGLEMSFRRTSAVKLLAAGLKKLSASGPFPVLVLDEALNVPIPAIDQLRLVAEEAIPPLLGMVLAGDETFRRTLHKQVNAPLSGRLAVRIRLAPMTAQETDAFVAHGFKTAGMQNILAPTALGSIHAASGGSPREVGGILSRSMVLALEKQSRLLSDEIVQEVLDERGK